MIFFPVLGGILALLNAYLYKKALRYAERFSRIPKRAVTAFFWLMNAPFLLLAAWSLTGHALYQLPQSVLTVVVYPFYAWAAMLLAFTLVNVPKDALIVAGRAVRWCWNRLRPGPEPKAGGGSLMFSRRAFLYGASAAVPPLLYGISAKGIYGPHDLEVSPEREIAVRGLPRAFDGFRITQISDLHVGAYIRERELERVIEAANGLRSDMIVMTGDTLDNNLGVLPVAQKELRRLSAPFGVFGILGNHDYYAEPSRPGYQGCQRIMNGLRDAGIHMLRDSRATIVLGGERLTLAGVDWTGLQRGNPNYYDTPRTLAALRAAFDGDDSGAPRILLAHHPHVFFEAPAFHVALTLAGHTHGGGQVVIAEKHGRPVAIGTPLYRYMSGYYREGQHHLYVNRGIGYVGLPIRINCPPEISRFRLVRIV
jgi:predicted MPP superfamily phosphohydrolase